VTRGGRTLFLSGDVMTGRGVDQILGRPSEPALWETSIRDARRYVELAEQASGPIPRPARRLGMGGYLLRSHSR
jgi:poly-gamma-glutamate capsule biosynthesis protein CapA/YwtB (metallophosphatase superfamily)